ncbi:MAG: hypothetical protein L3J70_12355 [Gammaproteobacteria bacterium]|nr:hypothetical protein [Gammaproteobacteria bacterium]
METYVRKELGEFSSIVCLKAMISGIEGIVGTMAIKGSLVLAGRKRGQKVAQALGLSNTDKPVEVWSKAIADVLGKSGTKLCILNEVQLESELIRVSLSDTMCSSGEEMGSSRVLDFTLGVIQGALEEVTGKKMRGKQVSSVLRGGNYDIVEYTFKN